MAPQSFERAITTWEVGSRDVPSKYTDGSFRRVKRVAQYVLPLVPRQANVLPLSLEAWMKDPLKDLPNSSWEVKSSPVDGHRTKEGDPM